jgi:hypothetical protein
MLKQQMSLGKTAFGHLTQSYAFLGTTNLKQLALNKLLNQSGQKSRIEPHLNCQLDHSSVGNSWSFFSGCRRRKSGCIGLTTIFSSSKVIPFYLITLSYLGDILLLILAPSLHHPPCKLYVCTHIVLLHLRRYTIPPVPGYMLCTGENDNSVSSTLV